MTLSVILAKLFKRIFWFSALTLAWTYFYKDRFPEPEYYNLASLDAPRQSATTEPEFTTHVNRQEYTITPKFDYELEGVIVSYHDADAFGDIWHHGRWKDFLNLRDLCVIWGQNVESGVYQKMKFSNDSWTCWASWPDSDTGKLFKMNALSNNHMLTDSDTIKKALMDAEPGDHIRLKGLLAEYGNKTSGFKRGTSVTRNDTGNGACETIYLDEFTVINKANRKLRRLYHLAKWQTLLSAIGFLIAFLAAPVRFNG